MSDTAAFFANKKKKKKGAFKFNANLIDASTVTPTVHVDAPALSTDQDGLGSVVLSGVAGIGVKDERKEGDEQWDDAALASSSRKGGAAGLIPTPASSLVEVLDMKSFDTKRGDQDNIAAKLRVEETKAQLAAAREGMERSAAKLKEEQERKEQDNATKSRFGSAAAVVSAGGTGGKWVPPHMRAGGAGTITPMASQFRTGGKLDVQDEALFPDLASAEKILEKKEKEQQPFFKVPKKTPVGGEAKTWASKTTTSSPPAPAPSQPRIEPPAEPSTTQTTDPEPEAKEEAEELSVPTKESTTAKIAPKKKKKKDLSTFNPGG